MNRPKILFISHIYPGTPAKKNPFDGIFIKELLKGLKMLADIFLIVPVDLIPGLKEPLKNKGVAQKLNNIKSEIKRLIFTDITKIEMPVDGKFLKYLSIPFKSTLPFIPGLSLFLRLFFARFIAFSKKEYNLIHAHTAMPDGLAAVLLGRVLNKPVLLTIHGSDVHSVKKTFLNKYMLRYVLRNVAQITCVSRDLKKRVVQLGVKENRIKVVRNGISNEFLNYKIIDIREKYNIEPQKTIILTVMRLIEIKDPITLIKAFDIVTKSVSNLHLVIVGDGHLRSSLIDQMRKLNLEKKITLTGEVPHNAIPSFMKASSIFCLSSLMEGFPTVLFEAMAFGNPVISTNVGGISEAVKSDDFGILVPAKNYHKLAEAIESAIKKEWDRMKIKAYARANLWDKIANEYISIYKNIIHGHNYE